MNIEPSEVVGFAVMSFIIVFFLGVLASFAIWFINGGGIASFPIFFVFLISNFLQKMYKNQKLGTKQFVIVNFRLFYLTENEQKSTN